MNNLFKAAALFSILMGVMMLATWGVLLFTGRVPELVTKPLEAYLLLTAEFLTAFSLIAGGYGLLSNRRWGLRGTLVAMGMLLYCVIFSVGVFGQQGILPAAAWFVFVAVATLFFVSSFVRADLA